MLHQHDLFDLQTTHTINDFPFPSPHPAPMPIFPSLPFSLYTTHRFHSPVFSHSSVWFLSSHLSFSILIYLFTSSPPSVLPLPLCFCGRLHIAVSQYHGGRQRGCRSGGECSTRTAGSHSHVQSWHFGQVRARDTLSHVILSVLDISMKQGALKECT